MGGDDFVGGTDPGSQGHSGLAMPLQHLPEGIKFFSRKAASGCKFANARQQIIDRALLDDKPDLAVLLRQPFVQYEPTGQDTHVGNGTAENRLTMVDIGLKRSIELDPLSVIEGNGNIHGSGQRDIVVQITGVGGEFGVQN